MHLPLFTSLVVLVMGQKNIDKEDRQPIIEVIRSMVYAQSESELLQYYNSIMKQDPHAYTTK